MIIETSLHTGSFTDYSGNLITVEFYRRSEVGTLVVVPSSIRFGSASTHSGVTAYWYSGSEPTLSVEYLNGVTGWLSFDSGSVSGSMKNWGFAASLNDTLMEREAKIHITNGLESKTIPLKQNR